MVWPTLGSRTAKEQNRTNPRRFPSETNGGGGGSEGKLADPGSSVKWPLNGSSSNTYIHNTDSKFYYFV